MAIGCRMLMKSISIPEDIERKKLLILRVLNESQQPVGARVIARRMMDFGFSSNERTIRYHLKILDERGLTKLIGRRDGRIITAGGIEELRNARVQDRLGFVISRIEHLSFRTTFDPVKVQGFIPVNITLFPKSRFREALKAMRPAFEGGLFVSDLIAVGREKEILGETYIPEGKIGLATVCSIVINGVLLKMGVPMDSKFGGILQVSNGKPLRFVELIHYAGSSLDPSEAFIRAKMTSVREVVKNGEGKMLANFREIPLICSEIVKDVLVKLRQAGIGGVITVGQPGESICEVPVDPNKSGMILIGGLNPVASAHEAGIETENRAMSNIIDFNKLKRFSEICRSKW